MYDVEELNIFSEFCIEKRAEKETTLIIIYIISIPKAIIICSHHKSPFRNSYTPFQTK